MSRFVFCSLLLISVAAFSVANDKPSSAEAPAPDVLGEWTGEWGPYSPAAGKALDKGKCKSLECSVVLENGVWQATFVGECGRPYKYTIKMEGRQVGETVLFKGTTDLGKNDGGVYDWIGRATDKEFFGFYTSSHHTGVFRMTRAKQVTARE